MPKKARCHWSEDEQMPERTSMNQQARRSGAMALPDRDDIES